MWIVISQPGARQKTENQVEDGIRKKRAAHRCDPLRQQQLLGFHQRYHPQHHAGHYNQRPVAAYEELRCRVLPTDSPSAKMAYEPGLMSVVARVFEDSLLRWYERRLAPGDSPGERAEQGGLLTVIQRSSGDMRLNPHLQLASSVPPPKQHLTRYSGVLAAAAHWRPLIIPPAQADPSANAAPAPPPTSTPAPPAFTKPSKPPPSGTRCRYIRWAQLLRLTFGLTVDECPACGGRMKLRALVRDPESIERFLRHQGLWSPPQDIAPARAPPYHRKVTRLSPTRHQDLFPET